MKSNSGVLFDIKTPPIVPRDDDGGDTPDIPENRPTPFKDAVAYYNEGNALFADERYQEAQKAYQQALELDPNYKEAQKAYEQALRVKRPGRS